jgi:hypothetical protein
MKATSTVERLKVHIDFPSAGKFRLTTLYKQREFEANRANRFINAETLEPIKFEDISKVAFYLTVSEHTGMNPKNDTMKYSFKAKITDRGGLVGETVHNKPLTVDFKMVRSK